MKMSGHLHDPAALASGERAPRYQLIRRLDAVSLAPAGKQHTRSSEHLDLVLTVHIVLCRCACVPRSALCLLRTAHFALPCFWGEAQLAVLRLYHVSETHRFSSCLFQAVGHPFFTAETRVESLSSSCRICGGRVALG